MGEGECEGNFGLEKIMKRVRRFCRYRESSGENSGQLFWIGKLNTILKQIIHYKSETTTELYYNVFRRLHRYNLLGNS